MKKIGLFLEAEPSGGGTFQYNQSMLDAVASLPRDKFCVVAGYTSDLWLPYFKAHDLKTVFVPKGFWWRAFCQAWSLLDLPMGAWRRLSSSFHPMSKVLLRERCDLWIFPSQDARSYQIPVPALVSIHDLMHRYERRFSEVSSELEYRLREHHYRSICKWAKGVLVDSETGKMQVTESYGLETQRIHVLPFIAPRYIHSTSVPEDFESRYPLPSKFIFYPAQFWEHKNHKRLIEALSMLKRDLPDLKLVLAGSKGKRYEGIAGFVKELNLVQDVIFLGYVPDEYIPEIYRRARAMVMPTFFGPTNIPPLEAFVTGCPVACSGIYAMPEQVGDAALLFDPSATEKIADCIRRLWIDDALCAKLAEKGKTRAAGWGQTQFNDRLREIVEQIVYGVEKQVSAS